MNDEKQKAYEAWRRDLEEPTNTRDIFEAGWKAAQSKRDVQDGTWFINQFKADRLRDKIMNKAVDAFRNGLDETARLYRELANELFGKQV